ncbi:MAG: hypothetical protein ACI9XR_000338 [Flavobacterium sp.]|jgi:hypothetical protein
MLKKIVILTLLFYMYLSFFDKLHKTLTSRVNFFNFVRNHLFNYLKF